MDKIAYWSTDMLREPYTQVESVNRCPHLNCHHLTKFDTM